MMIVAAYRRAAGILSRRTPDVALLLVRLALGWYMMQHGLQKLRGPGGIALFQHLLVQLGNVPFPAFTGTVIPWLETIGGILVLAGALTRVAALFLAGEMAVIVPMVKLADMHASLTAPSTSTMPSTELDFLYLTGMLLLVLLGPGRISVDSGVRLEPARPAVPLAPTASRPADIPQNQP